MPRPVALSLVLAACLPLFAAGPAASDPAASLPEPDGTSLAGITLGDSLDAVDARLDLGSVTPAREGEETWRYRWPAPRERTELRPNLGSVPVPGVEILFRDEKVIEIRTSYTSRLRYSRMGGDLIARYGEPSVVRAGPPRALSAAGTSSQPEGGEVRALPYPDPAAGKQRPRYLWVELWQWKWTDSTFTIIAEHYTEDRMRVEEGEHIFRYRLEVP